MSRGWNDKELEQYLRAYRPEPTGELVDGILARSTPVRARRRPARTLRFALAAALTFAMLGTASALGGVGGAAKAARGVATAITKVVTGPAPGNPTRTTICHATGSSTNPYVSITVDDNALAAHQAHQGFEDIIPAPPGGCPGRTPGDDQYKPGKGCGDKNHVHAKANECKPKP